jgi:hypothetical protein
MLAMNQGAVSWKLQASQSINEGALEIAPRKSAPMPPPRLVLQEIRAVLAADADNR